MTDQTNATFLGIMRDYGFATVLACALLYVGRQDIILPMVDAHRTFLKDIAETQREISKAVSEQTKLLYAIQRDDLRHVPVTVRVDEEQK